jgi:ABC-type sugar transport system substrate-binding protein
MKSTVRGAILITALALVTASLAGCSTDSTASTTAPTSGAKAPSLKYNGVEVGLPITYGAPTGLPAKFTVGYQDIYSAIPSLQEEEAASKAEVTKLGGTFITKDDQLDVTTQVNNCNTFIAQHVNAIMIYPLDPSSLTPCFKAAAAAGIIVIPQNAPVAADQPLVAGLPTDIIQGFDHDAFLRAQAVAKADPGSAYAIIGLAAPVAGLTYFAKQQKYWADKFGLKFLGEIDAQTDNAAGASTATTSLLAKYPTVKTIFTYNDNTGLSAASTVKGSGQTGIRILASDGTPEAIAGVKSGLLWGVTETDFNAIGTNQADAAMILIANPKATLPQFVTTPDKFISKSNVTSAGY